MLSKKFSLLFLLVLVISILPGCTPRIAVQDSVEPMDDAAIPFSPPPVILGQSRKENILIKSVGEHDLVVNNISLGMYEGFNDDEANGWITKLGNWRIEDKRFRASVNSLIGNAQSMYTRNTWKDLSIETKLEFLPSACFAYIFFRASDDFVMKKQGNCYAVCITNAGKFHVSKYIKGDQIALTNPTESDLIHKGEQENIIKISMIGNTISLKINGGEVWSGNDDTFSYAGAIGLGFSGTEQSASGVYIDDIMVRPAGDTQADQTYSLYEIPAMPFEIPPGKQATIGLEYEPYMDGKSQNQVVIESNANNQPVAVINTSGDAVASHTLDHSLLKDTTSNGPFKITAVIKLTEGISLQSATLFWKNQNHTKFNQTPLTHAAENTYEAMIPSHALGDIISYYIETQSSNGNYLYYPNYAPQQYHQFQVIGTPKLTYSPSVLAFYLTQDCVNKKQLTISNQGNWPTKWALIRSDKKADHGMKFPIISQSRPYKKINWNAPREPDTLLVGFAASAAKSQRKQIHSQKGVEVLHHFDLIPVDLVRAPKGADLRALSKAYSKQAEIRYVEPNYLNWGADLPNDEHFQECWGLHNIGHNWCRSDADIDAPEAWEIEQGNKKVLLAVIDSGIDYGHIDLKGNLWTNSAEQDGAAGVDDDANGIIDDIYGANWNNGDVSGDPMDNHSHGTHVSGTIGAVGNNQTGIIGVCPNISIMGLKFLHPTTGGNAEGSNADAIKAIEYALKQGVKLSNNSWLSYGFSDALKDAITVAGEQDHLFMAAAGNNRINTDNIPSYPASYQLPNIMSVAASDCDDKRASFSNYGKKTVHLAAPGKNIVSLKAGGGVVSYSGTSMATPHVAGAAALLKASWPDASALDLKELILNNLDILPQWQDLTVTSGRLNAHKALKQFFNPRISLDRNQGALEPGQSVEITVTADTRGTQSGHIEKLFIKIIGDPTGPKFIPVELTVK